MQQAESLSVKYVLNVVYLQITKRKIINSNPRRPRVVKVTICDPEILVGLKKFSRSVVKVGGVEITLGE